MKIIQLLPEFIEGGVERHVLGLSNELAKMGHRVLVVSGGGKLQKNLKNVEHWVLPVYQKNPATGLYAAIKIANRAKQEKWNLIHAHSRVPVWIAWWSSCLSGIPFVVTAHDCYSKNFGIYPFRKAAGVISVSCSVEAHLLNMLPSAKAVIYNGLPPLSLCWEGNINVRPLRFLFVGRLTQRKGLHVVIEALKNLQSYNWALDVVGDGPMRNELEALVQKYNLHLRVLFHGFSNTPDEWMKRCSCFIFPSLSEGMGLTLMRAIQMNVPVIASDLPPVRELCKNERTLIQSGDVFAWQDALESVLKFSKTKQLFYSDKIFDQSEMTRRVVAFYKEMEEFN